MDNERELCAEIRRGNKKAFEEVFRHFYPHLCAYAAQILNNPEDAEEIVQDVFFRIWQQKEKLEISVSLKAYLFKSVHNSCLNLLKHQKIIRTYAAEYQQVNTNVDQNTLWVLENKELHSRILSILESLPPERQKVFRMVRLEGRKYKDVAVLLGISVKTVENQMGKAMQYFRENLKDYLTVLILAGEGFHHYLPHPVGVFYSLIVKMI